MVKEGQYLAVFNSTHRVMKAEKLLKSYNIDILLIPAPRVLQAECGLAIRFDEIHRLKAINLLQEQDLMPVFISRFQGGTYNVIKELK